jgi:endonuclease III
VIDGLAQAWPDAICELDHRNAFELLCATILAAQSTDKMINTLTPGLFARYPDARALASAETADLEPLIFRSGFYRAKGRNLIAMARHLVAHHAGDVPADLDQLVALPGVARKTANVVLSTALGRTVGVVVDTHVTRLSARLGLTVATDPVHIERDLMAALPKREWKTFADRMIWHGRRVCHAKTPRCDMCSLASVCPSAVLPAPPSKKLAPLSKKPGPRAKKAVAPPSKKAVSPSKKLAPSAKPAPSAKKAVSPSKKLAPSAKQATARPRS